MVSDGLFFNAPTRLTDALLTLGAGLEGPQALAALQQQRQQRQAAQQLSNIVRGSQPLPAGVQGPPRPLNQQQRLGELARLTALGTPGADIFLRNILQGQISPEDERAFGIRERGLGLQERQLQLQEKEFAQTVKEFDQKLKGPGLTPKERLDQQAKLRKEFTGLSGEFIKQRDSFARVQASAEDPSAAGDLALIFNFMKILDPGSVVREGEFATAQNAPGIPDRVRAQYNRALEGERFTPKTRRDFVDRAEKLFARADRQQKKRTRQFTTLATRAGLDPQDIVLDLNLAREGLVEERADPTIRERVRAGELPLGTQGIIPEGDELNLRDLSLEDLQRLLEGLPE